MKLTTLDAQMERAYGDLQPGYALRAIRNENDANGLSTCRYCWGAYPNETGAGPGKMWCSVEHRHLALEARERRRRARSKTTPPTAQQIVIECHVAYNSFREQVGT